MNRLFVSGDLHANECGELKYIITKKFFPQLPRLDKEDLLIQLGDFAGLWYYENYKEGRILDMKFCEKIASQNYTMLVIPGNHENYDLINSLPSVSKWNGSVYVLETRKGNIYFAKRGEIYNFADKSFFTFSGAESSDIDSRNNLNEIGLKKRVINTRGRKVIRKIKLSQVNHWSQEIFNEEERLFALDNLSKCNYKVDYIFTHTVSRNIIPEVISLTNDRDLIKYNDPVANFLNEVNDLVEFKEWHFGHFHTNAKIIKNKELYRSHYMNSPMEINH